MAMVLSGLSLIIGAWRVATPLCSAAIHVSTDIFTYGGGNCKDYFAKVDENRRFLLFVEKSGGALLFSAYLGLINFCGDIF